jgi:hypothetical protein
MKKATYLSEDSPLQADHCDQHREAQCTHSVSLQERHQVAETDKHHYLHASEELVHIDELVSLNEALLGIHSEQHDERSLDHEQHIGGRLQSVLVRHSGRLHTPVLGSTARVRSGGARNEFGAIVAHDHCDILHTDEVRSFRLC